MSTLLTFFKSQKVPTHVASSKTITLAYQLADFNHRYQQDIPV